ncbi:MAG: hypothetical protein SFV23_13330, partial [Planctomycetaceae bacterium]|nr:hypothetical protein [Planctomycetaceae bacterium]
GNLVRALKGHSDDIYRIDFNTPGNRLVSVGYAGNLRIWDPNQDQPLHSQKLPVVVYSAVYSPAGDQIAVLGNDSKIYLVEAPPAAR